VLVLCSGFGAAVVGVVCLDMICIGSDLRWICYGGEGFLLVGSVLLQSCCGFTCVGWCLVEVMFLVECERDRSEMRVVVVATKEMAELPATVWWVLVSS
jgi:hypothetical protein